MQDHFILCGYGRIGARVLKYLRATEGQIVVIDNREYGRDPQLQGVRYLKGDFREESVLREAGVEKARGVLIVTSNDLVNMSTALLVHQLNSPVRIVVRMFNQQLIPRLGRAAENITALSTSALVSPMLAVIAQTGESLGGFSVSDGRRLRVAEITIRASSPLRGVALKDLVGRYHVHMLGYLERGAQYHFADEIDLESRLQSGDRLILCGEPDRLAELQPNHPDSDEPDLLLAGFFIRYWRVFRRTLGQIDLPVKLCFAALLLVVVTSTTIFYFADPEGNGFDAVYRTISIMATMADMRLGAEGPQWLKLYASGLRLTGAALVAAFTAILTNYLVRAQLGGALEVRRIPDRGHIVVCGLGNVGFRVAKELRDDDERVVIIERSADNPFISTARRQGMAVIIGDAGVMEVLREANVATAKAVVVAANEDLGNIEMALLAKEMNPSQRLVLRLTDVRLARTLREEADIRLAVSIPDLAAPAFVAALFGDKIHTVFFVDGHLFAVIDLMVREEDTHLKGQTVRAVAVDYRFTPVAVQSANGPMRINPMFARLEVGDTMTVIVDLVDLQRMLQRETLPRCYGVEIDGFPLPARDYVLQMLRTQRELTQEEAEHQIEDRPIRLAEELTRGQAEDLMQMLARERVHYRRVGGTLEEVQ
ncbi:MAG: potassium channel family protein [Gemmataceae bacterium]